MSTAHLGCPLLTWHVPCPPEMSSVQSRQGPAQARGSGGLCSDPTHLPRPVRRAHLPFSCHPLGPKPSKDARALVHHVPRVWGSWRVVCTYSAYYGPGHVACLQ